MAAAVAAVRPIADTGHDAVARVVPDSFVDHRRRTAAGKRRQRRLIACGRQPAGAVRIMATQAGWLEGSPFRECRSAGRRLFVRSTDTIGIEKSDDLVPWVTRLVVADLAIRLGDRCAASRDMRAGPIELRRNDRSRQRALC